MSRNNTGNPIDSKAYADFEDNVKNLDQGVNSDQDTFQDRLGKSRLTWAGIVKAGTGDPAIAVDAAARAVAAAGAAEGVAADVENRAEAIAQSAAERAASSVIISVDGAVDRAEGAAIVAESSAAAALASGALFSSSSAGLAATDSGQMFLVRTADPQKFDTFLNSSGSAVAQGQITVASTIDTGRLFNEQRRYTANGYRRDEFDSPWEFGVDRMEGGTLPANTIQRVPGGGLELTAASSATFFIYSLPYERVAGLDRYSLTASPVSGVATSTTIGIAIGDTPESRRSYQYHASGAVSVIAQSGTVQLLASASPDRAYSNGDEVALTLELAGDDSASVTIRSPNGTETTYLVTEPAPKGTVWLTYKGSGATTRYKHLDVDGATPLVDSRLNRPPAINIFPDPSMSGRYAGQFWDGTTVVENGVTTGVFEGRSLAIYSWRVPAVNSLRPGASLAFEFERRSDSSGANRARNAIVFSDGSGAQISRVENNTVTAPNVWEKRTLLAEVPSNAVSVELWAGGHSGSTEVRQRGLTLYSDMATIELPAGESDSPVPPPVSSTFLTYRILPDAVPERPILGFTCTGADRITRGAFAGCFVVGDDGRIEEGDGSPYAPRVHILDPACTRILRTIDPGYTNASLQMVTVDTSGDEDTIWILTAGDGRMLHFTLEGEELIEDAYIWPFDGNPNGGAYDPSADAVWVTAGTSTARLISCNPALPERVLKTITLGSSSPDQMHYSASERALYYSVGSNGTRGSIRAVNVDTEVDVIVYGSLLHAEAIEGFVIDKNAGRLYVFNDAGFHVAGRPRFNMMIEYLV